jgi:polysaccharide export outer membrane protein
MSPIRFHCAVAAAVLFFSTLCGAQTPASPVQPSAPRTGGTVSTGPEGVFRPAASDDADQQRKNAQNPQQPSPVYTIGKEYRIGPNDLLDIEILNVDNAKRTVRVNAAGFITLPLIGPVTVAGLTQQQAEAHIAGLYGDKYLQNPQVSLFIREFTTERITVDGAISKPGIYPLVGQMTLLRVLALAGGFGSIAKRNQVLVFRQGENGERQVATFDVEKIQAGQADDPPIRGDDLIVVQRDATRAAFTDSLFRDVVNVFNPLSYIPK